MFTKVKLYIIKILRPVYHLWHIIYNHFMIKKSSIHLKRCKNKHYGQRCFIVGNGPSLLTSDLEKLKGEICFGTHRIYHIFDETDWRPDYYCAQDNTLLYESYEDINGIDVTEKFVAIIKKWKYPYFKNTNYINMFSDDFYPELPKFSENVDVGIYEGFTVTYMCLQVAVYLGFKEIFLLGVDHNYAKTLQPDGSVSVNNDVEDHFSKKDELSNIPQLFKSNLAYESAKEYADKHGIRIYNATRGGNLEVFERVDFDEIFK